jgi:N,N-dimethylformamidase
MAPATAEKDSARPFRRLPDSWHHGVTWIFDGIEGEIIGDFGLAHGGAGGIEIDRYDLTLGTPPHSLILASSGGHSRQLSDRGRGDS